MQKGLNSNMNKVVENLQKGFNLFSVVGHICVREGGGGGGGVGKRKG